MDGLEFSVETLTQNNETHVIAITEKIVWGSPYCIEVRHVIPAQLESSKKQSISKLVKRMIKVLGANNCICHTEIKYTSTGPKVIETAARRGGDFITEKLVPLATGINVYSNIIKLALGQKIKINKSLYKYCGIQYLVPNNYEKFILNKDILNKNKVVIEIKENNLDTLELKCTRNNQRLGYYICCCENKDEVYRLLDLCKVNY